MLAHDQDTGNKVRNACSVKSKLGDHLNMFLLKETQYKKRLKCLPPLRAPQQLFISEGKTVEEEQAQGSD